MMRALALFGPTASGKSSLALNLAEKLGGVIISADSMQIYRGLNIGTAKPSNDEMCRIPHKMIDICDPQDVFSVYEYKAMAENEIRKALCEGKTPIVVGGTGMYFDALFFNTDFGEFEINPEIRAELKRRSENGENAELLLELAEFDPETAQSLHTKDTKRILRALEVYHSTGKPLSFFKKESHLKSGDFTFCKFSLIYKDRQNLYNRINRRVDEMIQEGLVEETRRLLDEGALNGTTASQAIGYKELLPYLLSNTPLPQCIELLKQKTRNYAKRQITWFRRYGDAHRLIMDEDPDPSSTALSIAQEFLNS